MKNKKIFLSIILVIMLLISVVPCGVVNAENIPEADVTVTSWTDLQNEINSATAAKVIKLGGNIVAPNPTTNSAISIAAGKNITINLNGYVLDRGLISSDGTATANGHGSVIELAGTLTIVDGNPNTEHKGKLTENGYFWNWDDGDNTGETVINGGIITGGCRSGNYNGGSGIRVNNNSAILNMEGGTITGNKSLAKAHAGGVYVNTGVFNMTGGTIAYNSANQHGGGVFVRYGKFNMSGTAKITKNSVSSNGGGVYLKTEANSSFTMTGGEISYNKGKDGGGVRIESSMTMTDGVIKGNIATGDGGGVRGSVIMSGGEIFDNKSSASGGGIMGTSTITGGKIFGNTAKSGGGYYGTLTMIGGEITGNTSTGNGGGVYVQNATLGGATIITGNHKGDTVNNVFLDTDKTITISTENAPTSDMNIGVTTAVVPEIGSPVAITSNGSQSDKSYFKSDSDKYYVLYQDNILKLVKDGNPTGEIAFEEKTFTEFLNTITFGLFFNNKFDVVISASDDIEIKSVEYYVSNKQLTEEEVKAITQWSTYSKFSIDSDNKYVIYAKVTDSIDNVTYISSDGFILDMTVPKINGLDTNKIYYTTQKFSITEENLKEVLIDDIVVSDYELEGNTNKVYNIKVIDKANNKIENFSITMKTIASLFEPIEDLTEENVKLSDKTIIENIKDNVENIDKTYATDSEKEELQEIIDTCDKLLEAINNKYISEVDLTITIPKAGQTVENNTFKVTSKYDNIVISVVEWKLNGSDDILPNDYVFEENKLYIPVLKIEKKNETHYFNEDSKLTVHGSKWSNGENTYTLNSHKDSGYVKDLTNDSYLIDKMIIDVVAKPKYEFIFGAGQTYTINKTEELKFIVNAEYSLFEGNIYVDDVLLKAKDFTSDIGTTIIVNKEFINSLKDGKHTLKVEFSDGGSATTNFVINSIKEEPIEETKDIVINPSEEEKTVIEENPKTNDNIATSLIIGSISLISLFGCCFCLNNKKQIKN